MGGELNACYNAVDRHVEAGKGSKVAIIHDSPLTATVRKISYAELLDQVYNNNCLNTIAKLLFPSGFAPGRMFSSNRGFKRGQSVNLYAPDPRSGYCYACYG